MPSCIAFLRSVNVGGRNRVPMADLRSLALDLGFSDPRTLLHSGNLVFQASSTDLGEVERALQRAILDSMGVETDAFVRKAVEWEAVCSQHPFTDAELADPARAMVVVTKTPPSLESVERLRSVIKGREIVRLASGQLFAFYTDGIADSKLTLAVIEKAIGTRATARNWNTALKLREMSR